MTRSWTSLPLVLALLAAAACRPGKSSVTPSQTMDEFTLSQTWRGQLVWELQARSAVLQEDAQAALLSEPKMRFYQDGRLASRVSALAGRVRVDTHDVYLSSSVVIDALEDRSVLRTESLEYSSARRLFTTRAQVSIQRPEGRLQGRGLEAKPDLSEIRIFNQQAAVKGDKT